MSERYTKKSKFLLLLNASHSLLPLPTVVFEKFKIVHPALSFCQKIGVLVGGVV
jgi:hypothetical protein